MILAFQSAEQAFGTFWEGAGALIVCFGICGFFWRMDRPVAALDRWFYLLTTVLAGIGLIAFGWVTAHS